MFAVVAFAMQARAGWGDRRRALGVVGSRRESARLAGSPQEVFACGRCVATLPRPLPRGVIGSTAGFGPVGSWFESRRGNQPALQIGYPSASPRVVASRRPMRTGQHLGAQHLVARSEPVGWLGASSLSPDAYDAPWCNGSTTGSGPVCQGSNPCGVTRCARIRQASARWIRALFFRRGSLGSPSLGSPSFRALRWRAAGSGRSCRRRSRRRCVRGRPSPGACGRRRAACWDRGTAPRTPPGCGPRRRA
jgi:hypothetical protein